MRHTISFMIVFLSLFEFLKYYASSQAFFVSKLNVFFGFCFLQKRGNHFNRDNVIHSTHVGSSALNDAKKLSFGIEYRSTGVAMCYWCRYHDCINRTNLSMYVAYNALNNAKSFAFAVSDGVKPPRQERHLVLRMPREPVSCSALSLAMPDLSPDLRISDPP